MASPLLYEINTRCWLRELAGDASSPLTLGEVPGAEFREWRRLGFTHIWLMGVWRGGPRSRQQALTDRNLKQAYSEALPGWQEADAAGSPYAIAGYEVAEGLGGNPGLAEFRRRLNAEGLKLILDFVPNHLGVDHSWVRERPDLFVQSATQAPGTFSEQTRRGLRWLAHGKDPYFPPWTDTVQLDYRRGATREAMADLLRSVAAQCDGVRCDMAMLLLSDIFAKTWEAFPTRDTGHQAVGATEEFWATAIRAIKSTRRDFLFLAEAYWGTERRLQTLGFDYTYDKALYDAVVARDAAGMQAHLLGQEPRSLEQNAHFLENHDEPRIAARLSPDEQRAAALLILGLPGLRFLHEGQLTGAKIRTPVQLQRRLREPEQAELKKLYERLLTTLGSSAVGRGDALLLSPRPAWPDNPTARNFVLVQWQSGEGEFDLVVVNPAPHRSQCYAPLAIDGLSATSWGMKDRLGTEAYERAGAELAAHGLFLDVPAHGAQLFGFTPVPRSSPQRSEARECSPAAR